MLNSEGEATHRTNRPKSISVESCDSSFFLRWGLSSRPRLNRRVLRVLCALVVQTITRKITAGLQLVSDKRLSVLAQYKGYERV